jgi:hypothetical protein
MLRKTLSEGFFSFSCVVRDQRSKSPGVISTISYELEMRANAKLMCVNVSAAICSGVYDLHDLRKCVRHTLAFYELTRLPTCCWPSPHSSRYASASLIAGPRHTRKPLAFRSDFGILIKSTMSRRERFNRHEEKEG